MLNRLAWLKRPQRTKPPLKIRAGSLKDRRPLFGPPAYTSLSDWFLRRDLAGSIDISRA